MQGGLRAREGRAAFPAQRDEAADEAAERAARRGDLLQPRRGVQRQVPHASPI